MVVYVVSKASPVSIPTITQYEVVQQMHKDFIVKDGVGQTILFEKDVIFTPEEARDRHSRELSATLENLATAVKDAIAAKDKTPPIYKISA